MQGTVIFISSSFGVKLSNFMKAYLPCYKDFMLTAFLSNTFQNQLVLIASNQLYGQPDLPNLALHLKK